MSNLIKIVGIINKKIKIQNIANNLQKNTKNLNIDNNIYIELLDYYTNLFAKNFKIANKTLEYKGVDLIYNSPKTGKEILIDIKTQINIENYLNLYFREFHSNKLKNRNYIIFNKNSENKITGKIYFISSKFIEKLFENKDFLELIKSLKELENLTYNLVINIEKYKNIWQKLINSFNNKKFNIGKNNVEILFLTPRKDEYGKIGNTNILENIKIKIGL